MGRWLDRMRPQRATPGPDIPDIAVRMSGMSDGGAPLETAGAAPRLPTRLMIMIERVAKHYRCTPQEQEEIQISALCDLPAALESFQLMDGELPADEPEASIGA